MARKLIWFFIGLLLLATVLAAIAGERDFATTETRIYFWFGLGVLAICEAIEGKKG